MKREAAVLMRWRALIQTEILANTRSQTVSHRRRRSETPGNDGSWLSVGKKGVWGAEDDTSDLFNVKLWHFYEACFENWQIQYTNSLSHSHTHKCRHIWLNNKFLYTAHRLQTKNTDKPLSHFSCRVLCAGTHLPPVSHSISDPNLMEWPWPEESAIF